jgi:hypothetical protein
MSLVSEQDSRAYEEEHVHTVYQQIAPHFSSTRYKVSRVEPSLDCLLTAIAVACSRGFPTPPRTWVYWTRRWVRKWQVPCREPGHLRRRLR